MLNKTLSYLAQPRTIWTTFLTTILLTLSFGFVMAFWQFELIDEMSNAQQISAHIQAMSGQQRIVHAWTTATIDVIYPFAYASFFIGVAIKNFGRFGILLSVPSFLVIPVDLIEGFAQVMLLAGDDAFMPVKVLATPVKLTLFFAGLAITAAGLLSGARRRLTGPS